MKASWNGQVIASAKDEDTVSIEGNSYFPPESLNDSLVAESDATTTCPWKGEAHYFDVVVDGKTNKDAAWYYPEPKDGSEDTVGKPFAGYVAFWNGVEVE